MCRGRVAMEFLVSVGPMTQGQGRGVIVTGAARGIGRAVARHLAQRGSHVALADVDAEAVAAAAAEIGGTAVACDVGSEVDVERLVAVARSHLGRVDAIVSNAGIGGFGPLAKTTLEAWNQVLATNLTATFLLAKAAAVDLQRARGAIVTIASTRAHMSEPDTLAYSASKGGLVALTHALAITLAPHVRVAGLDRYGQARAPQSQRPRPAPCGPCRHSTGRGGSGRLSAVARSGLRHGCRADRRRRHDPQDDLYLSRPNDRRRAAARQD